LDRELSLAMNIRPYAFAAAVATTLVAATQLPTARAAAPEYEIVPCCSLCPKASDPHAYDGSDYFDDFRNLLEGRNGWLFRSKLDLTTDIQVADAALIQLKRLADALRTHGTELVVIFQPPRALMDPDQLTPEQRAKYDLAAAHRSYTQALARFREAGITVPPLDRLVDEHKGYVYFLRRDHHWTTEGARHSAQVIAEALQAMPAFQGIPRQQFATRASGIAGKPGTLQKVASQICGGQYSLQYYTTYVTEPVNSGTEAAASGNALLDDSTSGAGGLLDSDGGIPEIALVGSSNSDQIGTYNFGGFLKQYLGADFLNAAITGAGYEGALLRYLPSEAFQKHPPKILIWEMPWWSWPRDDGSPYRTFNPYRTFRQAVPLVNNGCRGRPALLTKDIQLHAGSNEVLFNGNGKVQPFTSENHWLDFQFDDPGVQQFSGTIWYLNGQRESLKLHFKEYVNNDGRFVAELRNDQQDYANATFLGATVELDAEPPAPLHVTASLCTAVRAPLPTPRKTTVARSEKHAQR
jgi:alginate biosynthesis protein AlgX